MQKGLFSQVWDTRENWRHNRTVRIITQIITKYISIFYNNSSWNIIILSSFLFNSKIGFQSHCTEISNCTEIKNIFPFVSIINCNYTQVLPILCYSLQDWIIFRPEHNIPGIFAECSLGVAMFGTSREHLGNILMEKLF